MDDLFGLGKPVGYDRWFIVKNIGQNTWIEQSQEYGFFRSEEEALYKVKQLGSEYDIRHIVI